MIEIKTIEGGANCRITGTMTMRDLFIEGAACVGALVGTIANTDGESNAHSFVKMLEEVLKDKEAVNLIIQEGIRARGEALQ